uniref:NADH-ubiquinone oxidoreductase chain 6 n=2 Tax=Cryptolestes TaxID=57999 RepID=A0A0U2MBH1_9CUCU|nr:NADH dehydrogenase subunit 6 [Cryptolestes ferrugineus]YP_009176432.1 NADH dehydrogenase subunit 6 [Cryptolestes pusillus]ALI86997.1 NADH dehydrogenase subunit 6 [Cryptolestes ferrugineus]ALI87013.1 NADH dehydrogenase subunit 6 [Cryptolestes pusillus]
MSIMLLIMLMSMMFMFLNHPLSFGLMLLIQTLNISLLSGMMSINFWYSYMIFLIMVGGMLILFLYMTNVASNEKFEFSLKLTSIFYMFIMSLLLIFLIDYQFFNFKFNYMINNFTQTLEFNQTMSKFMTFPMNLIYIMIIIYLFITLIAIVKITNIKYGPLRQMN